MGAIFVLSYLKSGFFVLAKYAVGFGIGRFRRDVPLATERRIRIRRREQTVQEKSYKNKEIRRISTLLITNVFFARD